MYWLGSADSDLRGGRRAPRSATGGTGAQAEAVRQRAGEGGAGGRRRRSPLPPASLFSSPFPPPPPLASSALPFPIACLPRSLPLCLSPSPSPSPFCLPLVPPLFIPSPLLCPPSPVLRCAERCKGPNGQKGRMVKMVKRASSRQRAGQGGGRGRLLHVDIRERERERDRERQRDREV